MAYGGFTLLWRRYFEHPYWTEKREFSRAEAFLDCWACMAAFDDHSRIVSGQAVLLRRGEFIASERFLERRWRWSRGKVRRFLARSIEVGEIVRVREVNGGCTEIGTSGGTIYAIANYDVYQPRQTDNGTTESPPTDQREARESKEIPFSPTARAIGEFCDRLGVRWKLGVSINDWAADIERDPVYAGLDYAAEIKKCMEYHESQRKKPAPDRAIRNWLKKAVEFKARDAARPPMRKAVNDSRRPQSFDYSSASTQLPRGLDE